MQPELDTGSAQEPKATVEHIRPEDVGASAGAFGSSVSTVPKDDSEIRGPEQVSFSPLGRLPSVMPPVPAFDYDWLPSALRGWVKDISARMQCPPDYPAVAATVALATLVGRKVGIRPKRKDTWTVVPNLWGMLIGRPGVLKTPALQEATRPLHQLERDAKDEFHGKSKRYEAEKLVEKAAEKSRTKEVQEALQGSGGKEEAVAIAMKSVQGAPEEPTRRRYIVNDTTVEKLGVILNENPNGVLVYRNEFLGWLKMLEKDGHEADRAFYLEAWDGTGSFVYDRITRGTVDIDAAIVSLIGSIQPGPLGAYMKEAMQDKGDDGLVARFQLMVWPDLPSEWVNYDEAPHAVAQQKAVGAFRRLDKLEPEDVEAEPAEKDTLPVPFLHFDDEAQEIFDAWRAELEQRLRSGEEHPAFESHISKYKSLVPSLALIFHLVDGEIGPVGTEALTRAIAWTKGLETHAQRVYTVAIDSEAQTARAISRRIQKGDLRDGFTARDVYRRGWAQLSSAPEVEGGLDVLVEAGWLGEVQIKTGGRPRTVFFINPEVQKGFEKGTDKTAKTPEAPGLDEDPGSGEAPLERTDRTAESPPENSDTSSDQTDRTDRRSSGSSVSSDPGLFGADSGFEAGWDL